MAVPEREEVDAILGRWIERTHAFGATAGLRVPGAGDVFGAAGVDGRRPVTPMPTTGRFAIASVTKTFVTAVIMDLAGAGALDLDATIDSWLPSVPRSDLITVRMLLSHRSGIPDFANEQPEAFQELILADLERRFSPQDVIATSTRRAARFDPGTAYGYSNTNFQILGEIATSVTGVPIEQLIADRMAAPLDLDDSTLAGAASPEADEHHGWFSLDPAVGQTEDGSFDPSIPRDLDILEFPRTAFLSFIGAAGGMRSSLVDLLEWGDALYGGRVLGPDRTAAIVTPTSPPDEDGIAYGLGTMLVCPCDGAPRLVGHDGSLVGSRTLLVRSPSTGVVVAIHANVQEIALKDLIDLASDLAALTAAPGVH
jgi:D-alanyl-D-alanine carboxypeptidase